MASTDEKDEMGSGAGSWEPEAGPETGIQMQNIYLGSRTPWWERWESEIGNKGSYYEVHQQASQVCG